MISYIKKIILKKENTVLDKLKEMELTEIKGVLLSDLAKNVQNTIKSFYGETGYTPTWDIVDFDYNKIHIDVKFGDLTYTHKIILNNKGE